MLLIGATNIGRDLGPRCAARLHTGLTADATHLDIDTKKYVDFLAESSTIDLSKQKFDYEDRNLKMTRPAFGGHLMATIICPRFRPQMSTVRPGVMKKAPFDQAKADACQIVKPAFSLTAEDIKTEVLSVGEGRHQAGGPDRRRRDRLGGPRHLQGCREGHRPG